MGSLGQRLADELRVGIIRGELARGTHLVEDALAERFDVSRGPVRDALRTLAGEHLIAPQRRGYVVRGIDTDDVDELYEVRTALESLAAGSVARAPEPQLEEVSERLAKLGEAARAGDWDQYAHCDLDFHAALVEAAGNRRLAAMWEQLRAPFGVMLEMTNAQDADLGPSYEDHVQIVAALAAGKDSEAQALIDRHLQGSRARMLQAIKDR